MMPFISNSKCPACFIWLWCNDTPCHYITFIPYEVAWEWLQLYRLPMAEQVGCGTPYMLWSLGVREVVGSPPPPGRGNSKESFSSNQETGKVFSPEMPFYSKF